jgi:hypothetical protein
MLVARYSNIKFDCEYATLPIEAESVILNEVIVLTLHHHVSYHSHVLEERAYGSHAIILPCCTQKVLSPPRKTHLTIMWVFDRVVHTPCYLMHVAGRLRYTMHKSCQVCPDVVRIEHYDESTCVNVGFGMTAVPCHVYCRSSTEPC